MKRSPSPANSGSTLVVTISVVAGLLVLLAVAVSHTQMISRQAQRSRKAALAMEIADGHLEVLFSSWRNIYRNTWTTSWTSWAQSGGTDVAILGTNFFYTDLYKPGTSCPSCPAPTPIPLMTPSATPSPIPTPGKTNFPTEPNYTLTQYRIQAVDPMINLDSNENALRETSFGSETYTPLSPSATPPAAYGPNGFQYSYFYLAAADVEVPTTTGTVKAKVRRVFEKKFDNPWTYAMFFHDDLELHPTAAMTVNGPIHTNANLYIASSNFTTTSTVAFAGDYVNGFSPKDTAHTPPITKPNFAKSDPTLTLSDMPPSQVAPYLPFGWNLRLAIGGSGSNANDDSYHEIIERPVSSTDALANVRYYSQPSIRIVINADNSVTITTINSAGTVSTLSGSAYNAWVGNSGNGNSTTVLMPGRALFDVRENAAVKVCDVDVSKIVSQIGSLTGWTGLVYISDAGASTYNADGTVKNAGTAATVTVNGVSYSTTKRAIRLINGQTLPNVTSSTSKPGLTIVSENPVYIQGNYNTGGTPPSNSGTYTNPVASGYTRRPAAVVADAITVLSGAWSDANSAASISSRAASNTTVNAALVAGNVASGGGNYSGGGENFIRFLEDWKDSTFCYYGSLVQLYQSNQAIGVWSGAGNTYKSPQTSRFYYDDTIFSAKSPPGNLQIAAYLQQQRWYQVY